MNRYSFITLCLCLLMLSCEKPVQQEQGNGPQMPERPENVTTEALLNNSFEEGKESWDISGDADAIAFSEQAADGRFSVRLGRSGTGDITISQRVDNFKDGLYDVVFQYRKSNKGTGACYVASGTDDTDLRMTALEASSSTWKEGRVRGVTVKDGKCYLEIRCQSTASGWCMMDDIRFVKADSDFKLLKGGDISELTLVEREGGKYYWDGEEMDCIKLLKKGGFNIVRLRLYNDPGNPDFSPSKNLPAGIQDEEDILRLARRAKEEGMQIQLTFHYSDYWTNGEDQYIPHEWEGLDYEGLKTAVYDYTKSFLGKMAAQSTLPEYVSLGNEVQAGLLYPYGYCDNMAQMCGLFNAGAKAVREAAPEAEIIIHTASGGDLPGCNWLFGELKNHNVDYDVIGASYYPFWTGKAMTSDIIPWAKSLTKTFQKPIILMECGYAWHPTLPDGKTGQIAHNRPYEDMTKEGQKNFILEVFGQIKANPDCNIIGVLYWDPIFIEAGKAGWAVGGDNVVSNTTLFDFQGNALEVFDAYLYNN